MLLILFLSFFSVCLCQITESYEQKFKYTSAKSGTLTVNVLINGNAFFETDQTKTFRTGREELTFLYLAAVTDNVVIDLKETSLSLGSYAIYNSADRPQFFSADSRFYYPQDCNGAASCQLRVDSVGSSSATLTVIVDGSVATTMNWSSYETTTIKSDSIVEFIFTGLTSGSYGVTATTTVNNEQVGSTFEWQNGFGANLMSIPMMGLTYPSAPFDVFTDTSLPIQLVISPIYEANYSVELICGINTYVAQAPVSSIPILSYDAGSNCILNVFNDQTSNYGLNPLKFVPLAAGAGVGVKLSASGTNSALTALVSVACDDDFSFLIAVATNSNDFETAPTPPFAYGKTCSMTAIYPKTSADSSSFSFTSPASMFSFLNYILNNLPFKYQLTVAPSWDADADQAGLKLMCGSNLLYYWPLLATNVTATEIAVLLSNTAEPQSCRFTLVIDGQENGVVKPVSVLQPMKPEQEAAFAVSQVFSSRLVDRRPQCVTS